MSRESMGSKKFSSGTHSVQSTHSVKARKAYAVLGLTAGATIGEVKAAYRERARRIHPDRFADDPRQAEAAHEAFVELSDAFRTALAAAAATAGAAAAAANVPAQRRPAPAQRRPMPRAVQRPTVTPVRQDDPMLTLLTVPQRCARPWSAQALEVWALTVVPEARRHLTEAKRLARASGVRSERHLTTAAAHAVLTLTVNAMNGPRVMGVLNQLDAAYDALEIVLPREVVDRLPARVTAPRPVGAEEVDEPGRRLLAFCAASGALAAATLWTQFFGFFAG